MVSGFKISKVKDTRRKFAPRRKIQKLNEDIAESDLKSIINKYIAVSQIDASVECHWNVLKGTLLESTGKSYRWTKGLARHKETWW